jgi:hypothetical protein
VSARPIRRKQAHRLRKALRAEHPAYIDLIRWLKDRRYARSTGEAKKLILDGRVRSESHKLGIGKGFQIKESSKLKAALGRTLEDSDFEQVDVVDRAVSAKFRDTIQVIAE